MWLVRENSSGWTWNPASQRGGSPDCECAPNQNGDPQILETIRQGGRHIVRQCTESDKFVSECETAPEEGVQDGGSVDPSEYDDEEMYADVGGSINEYCLNKDGTYRGPNQQSITRSGRPPSTRCDNRAGRDGSVDQTENPEGYFCSIDRGPFYGSDRWNNHKDTKTPLNAGSEVALRLSAARVPVLVTTCE